MEFEWHTPRTTMFPSGITGIKRRAGYEVPEQPLAKRLERLSLKQPSITNFTATPFASFQSQHGASATSSLATFDTPTSAQVATTPQKRRNRNPLAEQRMEVDNDNVVYVDSLDSDTDEEEAATRGKVIFIPDIEKKLNQIPDHVLRPGGSDGIGQTGLCGPGNTGESSGSNGSNGMHLVLYSVPKSLTVPDENCDGVRKAIIESRRRLREKNEREAREKAEKEAQAAAQAQAQAAQAAQNEIMNTTNYFGMGHGMGNSFHAMPNMMNAGGGFGGFNNMTTANNGVTHYDPDDMEIEL
ncbi:hypothetical protein BZA77DRAFT_315931 [Pyronema omphalodes]|nr:hypothetical protein BZA77DRAFT_315931 [Pyronema omphalodes]